MDNLSQLHAEKDADASGWGHALGMGRTLFKNIPMGARFVFFAGQIDRPECILIRTASGYRHEIGGRVWKTGARTACVTL